MNTPSNKRRPYRRITPQVVALHQAEAVQAGNNTEAVRELEGQYYDSDVTAYNRAYRIAKKRDNETVNDYIERGLQQIGQDAIVRLGQLVNSNDEQVATRATQYAIDHLRGKAVTKSIGVTVSGNIQDVL